MNFIIRVYGQDTDFLPYKELRKDLEINGITVIQAAASVMGGCYFIEVNGEYKGKISIDKTNIDPLTFDWF
jgi:hypothetical protein